MKGDVEVMGQLTYLEVWNHTRFMDNMSKNQMTEEERKVLADLGI
jgi:DNA-binding transcriptional regulator/RsmH inhibitor MraZ